MTKWKGNDVWAYEGKNFVISEAKLEIDPLRYADRLPELTPIYATLPWNKNTVGFFE